VKKDYGTEYKARDRNGLEEPLKKSENLNHTKTVTHCSDPNTVFKIFSHNGVVKVR
jgi:hypothetical protein